MKTINHYTIGSINFLLIRGNLFQDRNVQAYVVTIKLLKKYVKKYFGFTVFQYEYPRYKTPYIVFSKSGRWSDQGPDGWISWKRLWEWLVEDLYKNWKKAEIGLTRISDDFVISYNYLTPIWPEFITLGEKAIILISGTDQDSGPRDEVKETFLKILELTEKQKLCSIGCIPFATKWAEIDAINGMVDAIKIFKGTYLKEVRLFEMNKENDQRIFSVIDKEI